MKYYAAVDKDGTGKIFDAKPSRNYDPIINGFWGGHLVLLDTQAPGFPNITWSDEPVEVELSIKVIHG